MAKLTLSVAVGDSFAEPQLTAATKVTLPFFEEQLRDDRLLMSLTT